MLSCIKMIYRSLHRLFTSRHKQVLLTLLLLFCFSLLTSMYQVTRHLAEIQRVRNEYIMRSSPTVNLTQPPQCTQCASDLPCAYKDEVDFRVVVLGFDRPKSLEKCLDRVRDLKLDGMRVGVEVWLDITVDGRMHLPTYLTAMSFAASWLDGRTCVHVQTKHSHVAKQWLLTWQPKENTRELALIVEGDVDISP